MSNVIKEEYKANTTGSIDNSSVPSIEQQATAFLWVDNAPRAYNETLQLLVRMKSIRSICVAFSDLKYRSSLLIEDKKVHYIDASSLVSGTEQL